MSAEVHVPVLLEPAIRGLRIEANGIYVDATFGRGGHARAILERLNDGGRLLAMDRDPQAQAAVPAIIGNDPRFEFIRSEIAELAQKISERGLTGGVDGVLFDLGVSSPQLDDAERGFSFLRDGPLDMRMDPHAGISAAAWLAAVEERELRNVLRRLGEEKRAARIARAIVSARERAPITRTVQLADIVSAAAPRGRDRIHPATRTFQAIRMVINDELGQLSQALAQSLTILSQGGRLCVITFHSLEDRLVKRFIRDASRESAQYRGLPSVPEEFRPTLKAIGRAIKATAEEVRMNPRARSARLRIAERL